jgi:hypothetical protein
MGIFQRPVGENGLLSSSVMISLDRLVMGGAGYPLLFQSGETWQGEPLIDRQHPHELFSGISIGYSHRITEKIDLYGYLGYPGEPAVGPVAFMHRASALSNPDAPLGHHWQDATHIVFGVATFGIRYSIVKLEGSVFTGREPDENRYDFDKPRFDSYSYRASMIPFHSVTFQFSQAFLESPELLHPGEDVFRTTASLQHSSAINMHRYILSSFVYGLNSRDEIDEHSLLLESNLILPRANVYGRFEQIQKSAEELAIPLEDDRIFDISAFTIGAAYKLATFSNTDLFAGLQGTINATDNRLKDLYGTSPLSGELYLRFSPSMMDSGADHQ